MHYGEYLSLQSLLRLQKPISGGDGSFEHDEMLFIVVHQAHELWFKQILFELQSVLEIFKEAPIKDLDLLTLLRRLQRVTVIQDLLLEHLNVLDTMSPMGFLAFRDKLAPSSGLQSVQFKKIEIALGLVKAKPTRGSLTEDEHFELIKAWSEINLYTCLQRYLERMPYAKSNEYDFWQEYQAAMKQRWQQELIKIESIPSGCEAEKKRLISQLSKTQQSFLTLLSENENQIEGELSAKAMQSALFIFLYRHQPVLQIPYQILTTLIKIDENLNSWRTKHLLIVQRLIGSQMGSGGTTGAQYLQASLSRRAFGSLTLLSSFMLPKALLPSLPERLAKLMGYDANGLV